jgi:hypothetical protein
VFGIGFSLLVRHWESTSKKHRTSKNVDCDGRRKAHHQESTTDSIQYDAKAWLGLNPDFPLGASSTLFECWRRIFGHFFRSSLQIARYLRLIHVKTASKSASTIVSNPDGNSGLNLKPVGRAQIPQTGF